MPQYAALGSYKVFTVKLGEHLYFNAAYLRLRGQQKAVNVCGHEQDGSTSQHCHNNLMSPKHGNKSLLSPPGSV